MNPFSCDSVDALHYDEQNNILSRLRGNTLSGFFLDQTRIMIITNKLFLQAVLQHKPPGSPQHAFNQGIPVGIATQG